MMRISLTKTAQKQYYALTPALKQKTDKQFAYLLADIRHPSLHTKKYDEHTGVWQGRIDRDWRFYFFIAEPDYIVISVIKHPK